MEMFLCRQASTYQGAGVVNGRALRAPGEIRVGSIPTLGIYFCVRVSVRIIKVSDQLASA